MSQKFKSLSTLIALAMIVIACGDDKNKSTNSENSTSTAQYEELSRKYQDLAARYESTSATQSKISAKVKAVAESLDMLDKAVDQYKSHLKTAHAEIARKQCGKAKAVILEKVAPQMRRLYNLSNDLVQNGVVDALEEIRNASTSASDQTDIDTLKSVLSGNLTGLKGYAKFSYDLLLRRMRGECADTPMVAVAKDEVVTVIKETGKKEVTSIERLKVEHGAAFNEKAYTHFSEIASATDGFVGFSPTSELLSRTVDIIFEAIVERAGDETDVAILLDSTSSMADDIDNVKLNVKSLLEKLKTKADSIGLKIALVEYRDDDSFLSQVDLDFTSDLNRVSNEIEKVGVAGGGDDPEAVLDALLKAQNTLSWRAAASRNVILISDAPGHPKAKSTNATTAEVMAEVRNSGLGIIVYPILVSR